MSPELNRARVRTRGTRRGRCYELAGRGILQDGTWSLVHGRYHCTEFEHAWLEREGMVYDAVLDQEFAKADYYAEFRAIAGRTYTAKEAADQLIASGHWGPWHDAPHSPKYQEMIAAGPANATGGRIHSIETPSTHGRGRHEYIETAQ